MASYLVLKNLKYMWGVIRLVFLIGPYIYLVCVVSWGSNYKHHIDTCFKEGELDFQLLLTAWHSIVEHE